MLWTELCPPLLPNSYIEALPPSVTVFRDRAFRRWSRLKEIIKGGALIPYGLIRRGTSMAVCELSLSVCPVRTQ